MRVALVGKGGVGKTTLAAVLCRLLAEAGEDVVALDGDEAPGLGRTLGADLGDQWQLQGAAARVGADSGCGGWQAKTSPEQAVADRGIQVRPGVRLVQFGKPVAEEPTEAERSSYVAFHHLARSLDDPDRSVVADLPAGTRHAYSGWAGSAGVVLVVVQPTLSSVVTARRLAGLTQRHPGLRLAGVANRVGDDAESRWILDALADADLPVWGVVPTDPAVATAEHRGDPLADLDGDGAFVRAAAELTDRLRKEWP